MTMQEAYALAAERQENQEFRNNVRRLKHVILGSIAGGGLGTLIAAIKAKKSRSFLDDLVGKHDNKYLIGGGTALGSTLGGLTGYGLSRLTEKSAAINKSAQWAELGRLIGRGGASLGRGLNYIFANSGKFARRTGNFSINKLKRFFELVGGGNENLLKDYNQAKNFAKAQLERARARGATGTALKEMEDQLAKVKDVFLKGPPGEAVEIPLRGGGVKRVLPTQEISDELGKIIAARTLATGGVIGGGYYAKKKYDESKRKKPWYARI